MYYYFNIDVAKEYLDYVVAILTSPMPALASLFLSFLFVCFSINPIVSRLVMKTFEKTQDQDSSHLVSRT